MISSSDVYSFFPHRRQYCAIGGCPVPHASQSRWLGDGYERRFLVPMAISTKTTMNAMTKNQGTPIIMFTSAQGFLTFIIASPHGVAKSILTILLFHKLIG